jgi:hypothetical protein
MKKNNKINPITFFRKANEARQKNVRASIKKAQDGVAVGPLEKGTSEYLDAKYPGTALKFQGPYSNDYMDNQREKVAQTYDAFSWGTAADLEDTLRKNEEKQIRSWKDDFNSGTGISKEDASRYRKGGSIKKKPIMKTGGSVKKVSAIKRKK